MRAAIAIAVLAVAGSARADQAKAPPPAAGAPAAVMRKAPPPNPQPAMPEMKPPQAVLDAGKRMSGSYACKGVDMNPDGSSHPSLSSMKISLDLDGYYILVDLVEQKTKDNPTPFKAHMFRTYDESAKKWSETLLGSAPGGPITMTTTDAVGAGSVTWTGSASMGQSFTERSHEEPDAATHSVHVWGEFSMDGGKTFNKDYDITCKK